MDDAAHDLAFLTAHSRTYQAIFASEDDAQGTSLEAEYADFADALPIQWSADKARTQQQIRALRCLQRDPEPSPAAIFHVLRVSLFPALGGCTSDDVPVLVELAEWLQLPVPLIRRLELHMEAERLRAAPPADTSDSGLQAALGHRLHTWWLGMLKRLRKEALLTDPRAISCFNAGLLGLPLPLGAHEALGSAVVSAPAVSDVADWHVWGRLAGGHGLLDETDLPLVFRGGTLAMKMSAYCGDVRLLQQLRDAPELGPSPLVKEDGGWNASLCAVTAASGCLVTLQWLRAQVPPCPWDAGACSSAAEGGPVEVLKWLRTQEPPCPLGSDTCTKAAVGGHLRVLQWLRAQDPPCQWDSSACVFAAAGGHLETLRWMRLQVPPCPWSEWTCASAAGAGHLRVLQWLRAQQPPCPWDSWSCSYAAAGGHLGILQWLRSQRPPCPWAAETCSRAAAEGSLQSLQWLRAQRPPCPWNKGASYGAAAGGHLVVMQWLRAQEPPCSWDAWTCNYAAQGGHLSVLQWLRAQVPPCPWMPMACSYAAEGGHLGVLQWLRAQDPPCPWDCRTIARAEQAGHMAVAAWARENGCS